LLTGRYQNHEEITAKFEDLNIKPPNPFSVLVFQFKEDITANTERNIIYLIKTSQKINITFYAAMGNEFIILASPPSQTLSEKPILEFIEFFIDQMKTRFNIDQIIGSSGTLYERYEKVEASYQEAQE